MDFHVLITGDTQGAILWSLICAKITIFAVSLYLCIRSPFTGTSALSGPQSAFDRPLSTLGSMRSVQG